MESEKINRGQKFKSLTGLRDLLLETVVGFVLRDGGRTGRCVVRGGGRQMCARDEGCGKEVLLAGVDLRTGQRVGIRAQG